MDYDTLSRGYDEEGEVEFQRRNALSYFLNYYFLNYFHLLALYARLLRYPSIDKRDNIFNNKFNFNSLSLYLSEIKPRRA